MGIMQCILQLAFIIAGLQREPRRSEEAEKTVDDITKRIEDELLRRGSVIPTEASHGEESQPAYIQMNRYSVKTMVSKLTYAEMAEEEEDDSRSGSINTSFEVDDEKATKVEQLQRELNQLNEESPTELNAPRKIRFSEQDEEISNSEDEEGLKQKQLYRRSNISIMASSQKSCRRTTRRRTTRSPPTSAPENNSSVIVRIVSETDLEKPDKKRLMLRNMVLALLIANACLWLYLSLGGTAYKLDYYQSHYFGATVWSSIVSICRPLSIFYRMHSAGCLFEIWSFA